MQGLHCVLHLEGPPPGRARDGRVYPGRQRQDPGEPCTLCVTERGLGADCICGCVCAMAGDQPLPSVQEQVRAPPHLRGAGEPHQHPGRRQYCHSSCIDSTNASSYPDSCNSHNSWRSGASWAWCASRWRWTTCGGWWTRWASRSTRTATSTRWRTPPGRGRSADRRPPPSRYAHCFSFSFNRGHGGGLTVSCRVGGPPLCTWMAFSFALLHGFLTTDLIPILCVSEWCLRGACRRAGGRGPFLLLRHGDPPPQLRLRPRQSSAVG